jgi:6-phospho-3-hexuloisomerase
MSTLYDTALAELGSVFARLDDAQVDGAVGMIAEARRVVVFGGGREKLQIMGFAMRRFHIGLAASVAGDTTTPPGARTRSRPRWRSWAWRRRRGRGSS